MKKFPLFVCSVFVDSDEGIAYVTDNVGCNIWIMDRELNFVDRFGEMGKKEGKFWYPASAKKKGDTIYVVDSINHRIQLFDKDMRFLSMYGKTGVRLGELTAPFDIHFGEEEFWILERDNHRVQIFSSDWEPVWTFGEVYRPPYDLVSDWFGSVDQYKNYYAFLYPVKLFSGRRGEIYIVNSGNSMVLRLDKNLRKIIDTDKVPFPFSVVFLTDGYLAFAPVWQDYIDIYTEEFVFVKRISLSGSAIEHISASFSSDSILVFDRIGPRVFTVEIDLPSHREFYEEKKFLETTAFFTFAKVEGMDIEDKIGSLGPVTRTRVALEFDKEIDWIDELCGLYLDDVFYYKVSMQKYERKIKKWMKKIDAVREEEEELKKIPFERADVDLRKIDYEIRAFVSGHRRGFSLFYDACKKANASVDLKDALKNLLEIVRLYSCCFREDDCVAGWYRMKLFSSALPHVLWEILKLTELVDDDEMYDILADSLSKDLIVSSKKSNEIAVSLLRKVRERVGAYSKETRNVSVLIERLNSLFKDTAEIARKGGKSVPLDEKIELYPYILKDWGGFLIDYNSYWWSSSDGESLSEKFSLLRALLSKRKALCDMGSFYVRESTRWDVDIYRDMLSMVISLEFIDFLDGFREHVEVHGVDREIVDVLLGIASFHKNGSFFKGFEDVDVYFVNGLFDIIRKKGSFGEEAEREFESLSNAVFPVFLENLSLWQRFLKDDPNAFKELISRAESTVTIFNAWAKGLISISIYPEDDTFDKIVRTGWMLGEDYVHYIDRVKTVSIEEKEEGVSDELLGLFYHFEPQFAAAIWNNMWEKGVNLNSVRQFVEMFRRKYDFLLSRRNEAIPVSLPERRLVDFVRAVEFIIGRI